MTEKSLIKLAMERYKILLLKYSAWVDFELLAIQFKISIYFKLVLDYIAAENIWLFSDRRYLRFYIKNI